MARLAVKIHVECEDEIRIWENAPDEATVLAWAEKELRNEFNDVGVVTHFTLTNVPISEIDREREALK